MSGSEKEFVDKVMSMHPPNLRDHDETYIDHPHAPPSGRSFGGDLRDFWRTNSAGPSDVHDPGMGDQTEEGGDQMTIAGYHHLEERSARPYSAMEQLAMLESSNMEEGAVNHRSMNLNQTFFENYSGNPYQLENMNASSSSHVATAYMEFFNPSCVRADEVKPNHGVEHSQMWTLTPNQHQVAHYSEPHVAAPEDGHHFSANTSSGLMPNSAEMDDLRRQITGKCSRSNDLLSAMTWSANAAIRKHEKAPADDVDNESAPEEAGDPVADQQQEQADEARDLLRAAIIDHPSYPELVVAHISIFKIGAPRALSAKLDDLIKKFQRYQDVRETSKFGQDPALDHFMRSYTDLLTKFRDDVEEPYTKFMQYKDKITKDLEDICGHYVETGPDEEDNYGCDIRSLLDGTHYSDEQETLDDEMGMQYPIDVDESIIVDPNAPDEELKKQLRRKYGRQCIAGLKAEFTRVKKKGKLPANARTILKDWFNKHSHWPYPSEAEKQYLQRLCCLNGKQINNWFINERKRHWSCEGKCMHPNQKFYYDNDNNNGRDNQQQ